MAVLPGSSDTTATGFGRDHGSTDARFSYPSGTVRVVNSKRLDCLNQFTGHGLAIAIEHAGVVAEEQGVLDAGEALALAAFDDNDIL